MPSASILTLSSDKVVSFGSPTTHAIPWDTETKYLDADVDFFDSGVDDTALDIPTSLDGVPYEVFLWIEDTTEGTYTDGYYAGLTPTAGVTAPGWWYIMRDTRRFARGFRSGMMLGDSVGATWKSSVREFDSGTITARSARTYMGVISGEPTLLGMARTNGSVNIPGPTEVEPIAPTIDLDPFHLHSAGDFTAPSGATLMVAGFTSYDSTTASGLDLRQKLYINGTEAASYNLGQRAPGPGCFGLRPISAGDVVSFAIQNTISTGSRDVSCQTWVEFY